MYSIYRSSPGQRLMFLMLPLALVLGLQIGLAPSAGAHSCIWTLVSASDGGSTIVAHSHRDCTDSVSGDQLTTQLWRTIPFALDDLWGQDIDTPPADHSGDVYNGFVSICEDAGTHDFANISEFESIHGTVNARDDLNNAACA